MPPLGPDEVLVETHFGAVSIGAELPVYLGRSRHASPGEYPKMTGYENVGVVIDRGEAVTGLEVGQRVFATYGHRTHGVVRAEEAIPLPDGVPNPLGLLGILSCDAAKGVRKLGARPEEPVLVAGAGAIGLLALFALRAYGVRAVDVVEPRAERRDLALELGARTALSPEEAPPGPYRVALECSGSDPAFGLIQRRMRPEGLVCVLSDAHLEPFTLTPEFHERELRIVGSSDGWDYREHARWYFEVLRDRDWDLGRLFDLEVRPEELPATFARLADGEVAPVKVLVNYRSVPIEEPSSARHLGRLKGRLVVPDNFDGPLPPELLDDFEGGS